MTATATPPTAPTSAPSNGANPDPMGATAAAAAAAPAGKTRKPDTDAPKRKALVRDVFVALRGTTGVTRITENGPDGKPVEKTVNTPEREKADADAIAKLLKMDERFKRVDFDQQGDEKTPEVQKIAGSLFFDYKIAYYTQRIADCVALKAGKMPATSAEKIQKKVSKLGKEIEDILATLKEQGLDASEAGLPEDLVRALTGKSLASF